ncbi:unnamed protein product, partial [marine sediment metagenome]
MIKKKTQNIFYWLIITIVVAITVFLFLRLFIEPENLRVVDKSKTTVVFDSLVMDLGLLTWNKPEKATYTFTNTGTHPLIIYRVTASCGCTAVEWPEKVIPPGKTGTITITYDAAHQGQFRKTVYVYANTKICPIILALEGTV